MILMVHFVSLMKRKGYVTKCFKYGRITQVETILKLESNGLEFPKHFHIHF